MDAIPSLSFNPLSATLYIYIIPKWNGQQYLANYRGSSKVSIEDLNVNINTNNMSNP